MNIAIKSLVIITILSWSSLVIAAEHGGEHAKPPAEAEHGEGGEKPKQKAKPKPKKPDKDKNCKWGHDISINIDGKKVALTQDALKLLMDGKQTDTDNYEMHANKQSLVINIKTPDGDWYAANMTRLGDPDEGCMFYMVGEPALAKVEPLLFN